MQVDLPSYENLFATFALVLIVSFALAALLDRHWRNAEPPRGVRLDHNRKIQPECDGSDDKDRTSNLYLRYADLSASLGAGEKQIRVHRQTHQNLEDD